MFVKLNTLEGKLLAVQIDKSATVETFKALVQELEGIPYGKMRFIFQGIQMENSRTLSSYQIHEGDQIEFNMRIFVKLVTGRILDVILNRSDTVKKVKEVVMEIEGVSIEEQDLTFSGQQLEDQRTLAFYNIFSDGMLMLSSMRVSVRKSLNETFFLGLEPSDTVDEVKAMIQQKKGISFCNQNLMHKGERMVHGRTMADYRIGTGSMLHLDLVLFVKHGSVDVIALNFKMLDTVECIKNAIWEAKAIAQKTQCLEFAGKMMEDDQKLGESGIRDGSVIVLRTNEWELLNRLSLEECEITDGMTINLDGTKGPSPRSGHRMFATEGYIYMIGGYKPKQQPDVPFGDLWRYNIAMEKWQECKLSGGTMPDCLASFSLVQSSLKNEVFVYGGTGVPFGTAASDKLYKIRVNSNGTFGMHDQSIGSDPLEKPPKMYGQAMTFVTSCDKSGNSVEQIFLIGGTNGHEYNANVWKLEKSIHGSFGSEYVVGWESALLTKEIFEHGRYRLEVIHHKNKLITFGGGAPNYHANFIELLTFDLITEKYINLKTNPDPIAGYPEERKCHALIEFEENVYVIGGCKDVQDPASPDNPNARIAKLFGDVWTLNLASMSWSKMSTSLPSAVFFHAAAVTSEGCIYVFGGCTDEKSLSRTNELTRIWLKPPAQKHLKAVHKGKKRSKKCSTNYVIPSFYT